MARPKFYAQGLRFECQGSGKCCTTRGSYGYVYLNSEDLKRFAKYFKLTPSQFKKTYCEIKDGFWFLRNPEKDCEFLEGTRCGVYEARPTQCRTWPFWPENLNPRTWNKDIAINCPGVGKGKLYTASEIEALAVQE